MPKLSKINNPIKMTKEKNLSRYCIKKDIEIAKQHTKRCSILLVIREMQVKTTRMYYYNPLKWLK